MLRRLTSSVIQSRGIKHQVKVTWVRPDYVPSYKPEKSGDLEGLPPIPPSAIGHDYAQSEEMKDASETVKKIFSVAHLGRQEFNALVKKEFMDRVRRHNYDENTAETRNNSQYKTCSVCIHMCDFLLTPGDTLSRSSQDGEVVILVQKESHYWPAGGVSRKWHNAGGRRCCNVARLTGQIRCLQDTMEKYPRNVKAKIITQELIDKRKKLLKFLRQYDYKKFEWLIEKLNIEYKGSPETFHKLSRKESLKKLTEMHCEEICNKKLADYRNLLESQQGPFLRNKLEALKFIKSEQADLQLPITISDQEIKKVQQMLDEWTIKDEIKQQAKKKKKNLLLDLE